MERTWTGNLEVLEFRSVGHLRIRCFRLLFSLLHCFVYLLFFQFIYLFIYLFLAALGLCCCARAFSSCSEWGLLFVAVRRLLIAVASLVVEHGL